MKSRPHHIAPLFITALVLLFSVGLHVLSRKLAEQPPDLNGKGAEIGLAEELELLTYDARVKLGAALNDSTTLARNMATLLFDDVAVEQVNIGSLAPFYAPATELNKLTNFYPRAWPWPRYIHGQIVRELAAEGATAVGFDIMFTELL